MMYFQPGFTLKGLVCRPFLTSWKRRQSADLTFLRGVQGDVVCLRLPVSGGQVSLPCLGFRHGGFRLTISRWSESFRKKNGATPGGGATRRRLRADLCRVRRRIFDQLFSRGRLTWRIGATCNLLYKHCLNDTPAN